VVSFDIKVLNLDPNARRVQLAIEGQILEYRQNQAAQDVPMQWPADGGPTQVVLEPKRRNAENSMAFDGPWALFRMLNAAEVRRTQVADRSRVIFNIGGRIVSFQLRAGAAYNPFQLSALTNFRCPSSL